MKGENANLPPKKRYELLGRGVVEGSTDDELLAELMRLSFVSFVNEDDFMFGMADRCKLQNGSIIDCYNVNTFIRDLVKYQFLKEVIS